MSEYIEVTGPIFETKVVNTATEPLPIYIVNPSTGTEVNQFSEVLSVPTGVLTLIGSYTVPVGKTFQLQWVSVSGTNIGKYVLKKNGSTLDQAYTYFSGGLSFQFEFPNGGISLVAGDVLSVSIVHQRLSVGDFNTRIQGIEF